MIVLHLLINNGEIVAAAQEERFTRKKHDSSFPKNAIEYCLKEANINANQISYVIFYEKPFLKFERLLETYLAFAPKGFKSFAMAMPLWIKDKLFQKSQLIKDLINILGEKQTGMTVYYFLSIIYRMQPVPFIHRPLKKQLF